MIKQYESVTKKGVSLGNQKFVLPIQLKILYRDAEIGLVAKKTSSIFMFSIIF